MSGTQEHVRTAPGRWTVVIPVKPTAVGKSRLRVDGIDRAALARAIALDTIAAAAAADEVASVLVVTDDAEVAASLPPGARVVPEGGSRGLNTAIATGVAAADPPRAVLLGDLPALRPADLDAALRAMPDLGRGVVPDAEGTGSTLVAAVSGSFVTAFGEDSFARHTAAGYATVAVAPSSTLRRDTDTAEQLQAAAALGVGPRTAALLG